jgi:uncharacterized RDD family membrane protein YckC
VTPADISPLPRRARPFQGRPAGIVSRLVAAVLDAAVVGALLLLLYAGIAAIRFAINPLDFTLPPTSILLSLTTVLIVLVLYLAAAWSVTGRTYGCHVMGLRVVTANLTRLKPLRSLARAVFCAFVPLGLLWCAVSRENLSLQDIVLRTSVIYDWQTLVPPRSPDQVARPPDSVPRRGGGPAGD